MSETKQRRAWTADEDAVMSIMRRRGAGFHDIALALTAMRCERTSTAVLHRCSILGVSVSRRLKPGPKPSGVKPSPPLKFSDNTMIASLSHLTILDRSVVLDADREGDADTVEGVVTRAACDTGRNIDWPGFRESLAQARARRLGEAA
ncbi:MAG: hypothetical protein AAFR11_05525 [Pseudomonadota bacterium]